MAIHLKVRFTWFQPRMNDSYFFLSLLNKHFLVEVVENKNDLVNLEFVGVYRPVFGSKKDQLKNLIIRLRGLILRNNKTHILRGNDHQNDFLLGQKSYVPDTLNSNKRIWFSFENIRPPTYLDSFDLTLSTDKDHYFGKNIYFPWMYYILNLQGTDYDTDLGGGTPYKAQDLINSRKLRLKYNSAIMIINNFHPVRMEFAKQLAKIMPVDIFGQAVGRPVNSKYELVSNYKYMICFENDLYPGWITEKPIHAWMCDTVPLYWGWISNDDILNQNALINVSNFGNLEEAVDYIKFLSDEEYAKIFKQPILKQLPNMKEIEKAILAVAKKSLT